MTVSNYVQSLSDAEVKDCILQVLRDTAREGIENVMDYMENKSDFFSAPASTRFHLCVPGGLARHSLNVYYRMMDLVGTEHQKNEPGKDAPQEVKDAFEARTEKLISSCGIVGLLHDICKTNVYKRCSRNQKTYDKEKLAAADPRKIKNDSIGPFIWESVEGYSYEDGLPYGHGEKSVYILSAFIKLTREEAMAIRWHMGPFDNSAKSDSRPLNKVFEQFPFAFLTYVADSMATNLDDDGGSVNLR